MSALQKIYGILYKAYGPQGYWPLSECRKAFNNSEGCHYSDHSFPKTPTQSFEIMIDIITSHKFTFKPNPITKYLIEQSGLKPDKLLDFVKNSQQEQLSKINKWGNIESIKKFCELQIKAGDSIPRIEDVCKLIRYDPIRDIYRKTYNCKYNLLSLYIYRQPEFILNATVKKFIRKYNLVLNCNSHSKCGKYIIEGMDSNIDQLQELFPLIHRHIHEFDALKEGSLSQEISNTINYK
jgi:endonuclease-3 related protein